MSFALNYIPGMTGAWNATGRAAAIFVALILAACGGSGSSANTAPTSSCDPNNPGTFDQCGTVIVAITDADGDFLNYTVDVLSLRLEAADGRVVETLPRQTRINFTDYVDLTELVSVATVPPGTYVAGMISLDYSDAEIIVEAAGVSKAAIVTDLDGIPLTQTTLRIVLSNHDQLLVVAGRTALLQLDFDLDASHEVNIEPTPAIAVSQQIIVAEVQPVDEKDFRVRGPLVEVSAVNNRYVVAIRPFHDRDGDFGEVTVNTTSNTEFEVNGEVFIGSDGLRALNAAGRGTPTVAKGTLNVSDRRFTANIVLAGSSVPGIDFDAVIGNVIARNNNLLTVRGATIVPSDLRAHFHDDVIVEIGPDTKVFRDGHRGGDLGIDAISIGQRLAVRGVLTQADPEQPYLDATQGAARLSITHLAGVVNSIMPGQTDITLHAIGRRRADIFDFSGTGPSADLDANPDNYEVATGTLLLSDLGTGQPVVVYGFPTAFGIAPPDFMGRTVIDFSDVRSALGVGWGTGGTVAPFLSMGDDGLLLNNQNADIDQRHPIKQGTVLIDLTTLDSSTLIAPRQTDRTLFWIATADSVREFSNFDDFIADLGMSLNGATTARAMFARGKYDAGTNVFTAYKIGVYLLEP
ncbi:MAG: hypothetical protein IIA78_02190 [Proteobacteria bacterium]|nr:hypothetical protein [Pseudomonadota bacterium]